MTKVGLGGGRNGGGGGWLLASSSAASVVGPEGSGLRQGGAAREPLLTAGETGAAVDPLDGFSKELEAEELGVKGLGDDELAAALGGTGTSSVELFCNAAEVAA